MTLKNALPVLLFLFISCATIAQRPVWSQQKANEWYGNYRWMTGADFIPSTAINQLEMWQAETFDTTTIDRELGYAQSIGMKVMRVFLHHAAWQQDEEGFKQRMHTYLDIADKHNILTMFVFFDDVWNKHYMIGTQPQPRTGIHNSGWVQDPGDRIFSEPKLLDTLERYVKAVLTEFKHDKRIFLWDLYNEPGNSGSGNKTLPLLKKEFAWARKINPDQPLSAGVWNKDLTELNTYQLANSDIITYHNYEDSANHKEVIDSLKKYDRPLVCTEYMARLRNSTFFNIMPLLKANKVVAINWGLVAGKTNTMYAWDTPVPDGSEPKVWFHDIFRPDGSAFSDKEVAFIHSLTSGGKRVLKTRHPATNN